MADRLNVVLFFEFGLELEIVRNNTVMHQRDSLLVIKVGMGVRVSLVSVSRPTGVTDPDKVVMLTLTFELQSFNAVASKAIGGSEFVDLKFSRL